MLTVEQIMAMKDPHTELCGETGELHKSSEVLAQLTPNQQLELASKIVISLDNKALTKLHHQVNGFNPNNQPEFAKTLGKAVTLAKRVQALKDPCNNNPQAILKGIDQDDLFKPLLTSLLIKHRESIIKNITQKGDQVVNEIVETHPALSRTPSLVDLLPAAADQEVVKKLLNNTCALISLPPEKLKGIEDFLNEDSEEDEEEVHAIGGLSLG